jgi:hypothetical protein
MINYIFIFPLIAFSIIAYYTFRTLFHQPYKMRTSDIDLPNGIPIERIGIIEGNLTNLKRVIVIADRIERPESKLIDAVERNFERGVEYLFLVSSGKGQDQLDSYYQIFRTIANIVMKRKQSSARGDFARLCTIKELPYNWDNYPYIFYQVQLSNENLMKTLAFRGDQLHEGIADHYGRVEPAYAHTILSAVLADAPKGLDISSIARDQFESSSKIEFDNPSYTSNTSQRTIQ